MATKQMCYEQNFLSKVILRVDFASNRLPDLAERPKFIDAISGVFPHAASTSMIDLQVEINDGAGTVNHKPAGTQWNLRKSINGTAQCFLTPSFLALDYGPGDYQSFNALFEEFSGLLDNLTATFGEFPFDRVGLRYVNEIRLPGKALEWNEIIRKDFVSAVLATAYADGRLVRSMHQVTELHDDDLIVFNYGLFNPDFPAPLVQRHFVLDIDCSRSGVIARANALDCIRKLNDHATSTFESSIEDGLRKIMGVKNE